MRIISEARLRDFCEQNQNSEAVMREWIKTVRQANWSNFFEVRNTFNHTDTFKNCVIFDVGGNKFRIIAKVSYRTHIVFIRFALTHAEYSENKMVR